jgi:hypothetical protein
VFSVDSPFWYFRELEGLCGELLVSPYGVQMAIILGGPGERITPERDKKEVFKSHAVFVHFEEMMSHTSLIRLIAFKISGAGPRRLYKCVELIEEELKKKRRVIIVTNSHRMMNRHYEALRYLHDAYRMPLILIGEKTLKERLSKNKHMAARVLREIKQEVAVV